MLTITPFSNKPQDLPVVSDGSQITENHQIALFNLNKQAGDRDIAQRMSIETFFEGVNTLVSEGDISGPVSLSAEAVTATVGGASVPATASFVTVTSSDANHIVILPAPVVGKQVILQNGATGYELRTSSPSTISINGGSGANAESAIGATVTVYMTCISATAWKGFQQAANGTVSAVEVAA